MIPFLWNPAHIEKRKEIMASWGKRCDIIRFMIDPVVELETGVFQNVTDLSSTQQLPENVIVVPNLLRTWHDCPEKTACRDIWGKVWRSIVWVDDHEPNAADRYVKADSDTFLFPHHLKRFVEKKGWTGRAAHEEHHYFGHVDYHRSDRAFVSGAGVFFSAHTFKALAQILREMPKSTDPRQTSNFCEDSAGSHEEPLTADCLKKHLNVDPEPTWDEMGRERVLLFEVNYHMVSGRGDWWYWQGKPQTVGEKDNCCSPHQPLAFHRLKQVGEISEMERILYGNDNNSSSTISSNSGQVLLKLNKQALLHLDEVRKELSLDEQPLNFHVFKKNNETRG
jgi:hypothetical protein